MEGGALGLCFFLQLIKTNFILFLGCICELQNITLGVSCMLISRGYDTELQPKLALTLLNNQLNFHNLLKTFSLFWFSASKLPPCSICCFLTIPSILNIITKRESGQLVAVQLCQEETDPAAKTQRHLRKQFGVTESKLRKPHTISLNCGTFWKKQNCRESKNISVWGGKVGFWKGQRCTG